VKPKAFKKNNANKKMHVCKRGTAAQAIGNAFYILGAVTKALKRAGYDKAFIQSFQDEATNGDYNHLLQTVMEYVIVE